MTAEFSRRQFATLLPGAALAMSARLSAAVPSELPTAGDVVSRIHTRLKSEGIATLPLGQTVDRFIVGDSAAPVTGIATTFMCTIDVMRRAARAGLSLIISHEPTFWNHMDDVAELSGDPTFAYKRGFAEENGLTIWRLHDYWHQRKPDPIGAALSRKLGLPSVDTLGSVMEIRPVPLEALVRRISVAFGSPNIRYWGDPARIIRRVRWGGHPLRQITGLDSDVFLWPEPKEFNTFDYFRDAEELGIGRCIIGATHELLEEWGMLEPCAEWMRALVPEVPVIGLRTSELYWTV